MITAQLVALDIIHGASGGITPPLIIAQPLGGTMGADMGEYEARVRQYWQQIEAARAQQRRSESEQRRIEAEAAQERERIHARMAELRAIKARKKADRERIASELATLQLEEDQARQAMAAASQSVLEMIQQVNALIMAMEAYKRRYQASLIMLLLGVN